GLVPALDAARPDRHEALKDSARGSAGPERRRFRRALVVTEVALSLVLLAGAGLLIKSFYRLQQVDPGFDPARLLGVTIYLPDHRYPQNEHQAAFYAALLERVRALPGVTSAGAVTTLPFSPVGVDHDMPVSVDGRPQPEGRIPEADFRITSPGYFETMAIPVVRGRTFDENDRADAPLVAVVNQEFARTLLAGEDPIGTRIRYGHRGPPIEIVGLVGQVRHRGLDAEPRPELYVPYRQLQYGTMTLVVRAAGDPLTLAEPVKRAVYAVDPAQPVTAVATMAELMQASAATRRFHMVLFAGFAALALGLAAVGLYGVISYAVTQRGREIGIRLALGAAPRDVFRVVLGDGVRLAAAGVVIGLVGAVALTRLLATLLFSVSPTDPLVLATVAAALVAVAGLACALPARRATRVDPVVALRTE
ncbi:MAG: FtsX-like permease family protein, partial [Gemmatimonadales bacterium]